MKREIIIAQVLDRLREEKMDPRLVKEFGLELKEIYSKYRGDLEDLSFPKEILRFVGNFMDEHTLSRKDKIMLLNEAKKNKLFNFNLNKNLERAWRAILKKWDLRNYRLEGGF